MHKITCYADKLPTISPVPVKRIIKDAMAGANIKTVDILEKGPFNIKSDYEDSKRYFQSKGYADFYCPNKHHWYSSYSRCFLDLKTQVICYMYEQKCTECEQAVKPCFRLDAVESMAERAVKMYAIRKSQGPRKNKGPHKLECKS